MNLISFTHFCFCHDFFCLFSAIGPQKWEDFLLILSGQILGAKQKKSPQFKVVVNIVGDYPDRYLAQSCHHLHWYQISTGLGTVRFQTFTTGNICNNPLLIQLCQSQCLERRWTTVYLKTCEKHSQVNKASFCSGLLQQEHEILHSL